MTEFLDRDGLLVIAADDGNKRLAVPATYVFLAAAANGLAP